MSLFMETAISLFDAVICVYFITKFNHAPFRKNKFWIPAILIIFGFTLINDAFMAGFNTLATLIFLALYIAYSLTVANGHYVRAILSAFMFEIVFVLLSSLIYSLQLSGLGWSLLFMFLLYQLAPLSIGLGLFNLLPIPPLDGSKVLAAFLPDAAYIKLMRYERYGMIILLALSWFGLTGDLIGNAIMGVYELFFNLFY
jgi:Zn-dependent protease